MVRPSAMSLGSADLPLVVSWVLVQHKLILLLEINASVVGSSNQWASEVQGVIRVIV